MEHAKIIAFHFLRAVDFNDVLHMMHDRVGVLIIHLNEPPWLEYRKSVYIVLLASSSSGATRTRLPAT